MPTLPHKVAAEYWPKSLAWRGPPLCPPPRLRSKAGLSNPAPGACFRQAAGSCRGPAPVEAPPPTVLRLVPDLPSFERARESAGFSFSARSLGALSFWPSPCCGRRDLPGVARFPEPLPLPLRLAPGPPTLLNGSMLLPPTIGQPPCSIGSWMQRSNGCLLPQLAVEACRKTEPG